MAFTHVQAKVSILVALFVFMAGVAFGQGAEAEISGAVTDSSGAVIPGAQVTLINAQNGVTRSLNVQPDGRYRFAPVAPGVYNISAKAPSFQTENIT